MKAVGYQKSLPIDETASLVDVEVPTPELGARDLLVKVEAVSMNPVDTKVRMRAAPETGHKVLGYDAVGIVAAVGAEVSLFQEGDKVFYAGDVTRPGTNSQFHAVDERIVGRAPKNVSATDAAALPLTAITAWEMLFDCFRIPEGGGEGQSLLVIGGAGGVGSIMIQLAKALTKLTVVATASRAETIDWVKKMGADYVVNHREPLGPQLAEQGVEPTYVAALTASDQHFPQIVDYIKPRGHIGMIDDPGSIDINLIKPKALSFHFEFMFTRAMFQTEDMQAQHELLNRVADLVESGELITTANHNAGEMSATTLKKAHALQESGKAVGKTVLSVAY